MAQFWWTLRPLSVMLAMALCALAEAVNGQPVAQLPTAASASSAPVVDVLRGEALRRFLVGTWTSQEKDEESLRITSKQRFRADGSFSEEVRAFLRLDPARDMWSTVGSLKSSGVWTIEDDVLVETTQKASAPAMKLPLEGRFKLRALSEDELEVIHSVSGRKQVAHRLPVTDDRHLQALRAPQLEPTEGDWSPLATAADGDTHYIDEKTLRRDGDFAAGWVQSTMSQANRQAAKKQAEAVTRAGGKPLVMERVQIAFLVDCAKGLFKRREIRIFDGGRLAGGSTYPEEDPTDWDLITPGDSMESAVRRRACAPP
jgi:hypothetical protein